jgi:hypothetical protein
MKPLMICLAMLLTGLFLQQADMKKVSKNNMTVRWKIEQEIIHFELEAPTDGWVAIGFNETASLTGTYLLMGRVRNGKTEVVEHYTAQPGSYKPIAEYGVASQTTLVSGNESGNMTRLKFAVPIAAASKYHKELRPGTQWTLLMAYSSEDDFQHHSMMRTSMDIKL